MKLSNQNIYNLRGCKNFWGRCQMPLGEGGGGGCKSFLGVCTPAFFQYFVDFETKSFFLESII